MTGSTGCVTAHFSRSLTHSRAHSPRALCCASLVGEGLSTLCTDAHSARSPVELKCKPPDLQGFSCVRHLCSHPCVCVCACSSACHAPRATPPGCRAAATPLPQPIVSFLSAPFPLTHRFLFSLLRVNTSFTSPTGPPPHPNPPHPTTILPLPTYT